MLYDRTANEIALSRLFREYKRSGAAPFVGNCLVLLYSSRRDCDLVLEGLAELNVAYLPPEWYEIETVARHQEANPHGSLSSYLSSLLAAFPDTVAIPVRYGEFFALARLGLFEPPPRGATFALLQRRRGVDEAAAAYLDETGVEDLTLGELTDESFAWLLDRSFTLPQQREVVRSFMDARRLNNIDMRMEQWRGTPHAFYDRLLKHVSVAAEVEASEMSKDGDRRQIEQKIVGWVRDRFAQTVQAWTTGGWPDPVAEAELPIVAPSAAPEPVGSEPSERESVAESRTLADARSSRARKPETIGSDPFMA